MKKIFFFFVPTSNTPAISEKQLCLAVYFFINFKIKFMNKAIILILMLILSTNLFSQQTEPSPSLSKDAFLQKSKRQKSAAWILLAGGFASSTISVLIAAPKATEDYLSIFPGVLVGATPIEHNYTGETILLIAGTAAMLSSIPLFIAAGKNKRKAMNLVFKNEIAPQVQRTSFVYRSVPSLSLKIDL